MQKLAEIGKCTFSRRQWSLMKQLFFSYFWPVFSGLHSPHLWVQCVCTMVCRRSTQLTQIMWGGNLCLLGQFFFRLRGDIFNHFCAIFCVILAELFFIGVFLGGKRAATGCQSLNLTRKNGCRHSSIMFGFSAAPRQ